MINVKRFVDINIKSHQISTVSSIRDTAVLIVETGSINAELTSASGNDYNNLSDTEKKYVDVFFACGGAKLKVISAVKTGSSATATELVNQIKTLGNELIVIAYAGANATFQSAASTLAGDSTVYGVNSKILVTYTSTTSAINTKNLAIKYTSVAGEEMSIAAYLTKINFDGIDTVQDYNFTKEPDTMSVIDNDGTFGTLQDNNINVDIVISGVKRNCGGNLGDGKDLVNEFALIVLQQTVTDAVMNVLVEKPKDESGLARIRSAISGELARYVINGYLTQTEVWTDEDLTIAYNNITYTVVEKNTALQSGYIVKVLPMSSLTQSDKAARKAPPIYLVLADSYGIRKVTINGETI